MLLPLLALVACGTGERAPSVVRLASLLGGGEAETVPVAHDIPRLAAAPVVSPVGVNASRVGRLTLRARGDAKLLEIAWRVAAEHRFSRFRHLSISLAPDGEEHVYEVDLRREPYWTGEVTALRWTATGGGLEILEVTGETDPAADRLASLRGLSLPSLPGLRQISVEMPAVLPPDPVFETHLGLFPKYDRPGVVARFRVVSGNGADEKVWVDQKLRGGSQEGWLRLRAPLDVAPSQRLRLEVSAERHGRPLPEGAAVWGEPVLVGGRRPPGRDLVIIVVDTLRADAVGAYGRKPSFTPNLDRLAARSVRFAQLLAPAPWTLPSVASLLTGFQPQVHGAGRRVGDFAPTALGRLPSTLAEALTKQGFYATAVYNNIYLNPSFGVERGFDEYAWYDADDSVLVDRALDDLHRNRDRRHFLFLHLFGPHNPYAPPEEVCESVSRSEVPDYRGSLGCSADRRPGRPPPPEADRAWIEALYHGDIAWTDRQLGRFFAGLEKLGLSDRTLVALVSDHGETFWRRLERSRRYGYEDADHGQAHYQELLHVVGLLAGPGIRPGVVEDPVEMVDIEPTLFGLLGLEPPHGEGIDLGPALVGGRVPRKTLISDDTLYGPSRWSVRRGPWKLIVPEEEGLPLELYDLDHDPGERRNVVDEHPDIVRALRQIGERERQAREAMRRRFNAGRDSLSSAYLDWNHITKLRALGYLK